MILPTGLGKTMIALLVSESRLKSRDFARILFLAPTKPLADQHYNTFRSMLAVDDPDRSFSLLTGDINPEKRQEVWSEARLIFARYDLSNGKFVLGTTGVRCR